MSSGDIYSLVLRLAGPLQSWGYRSQFNYRETGNEPTKSGIIGLLAAAEGRRRDDPIKDLVGLVVGVRVDQPGTMLRDYHTVSDYRGLGLPMSALDAKGTQKRTTYQTRPTERFYLQDAVFIAAVQGAPEVLEGMAEAVTRPGFPLALGRRACVPTQPILFTSVDRDGPLWPGTVRDVLGSVPWLAAAHHRNRICDDTRGAPTVPLPVTVDDPAGDEVIADVPASFAPSDRQFSTRRVTREHVHIPTGFATRSDAAAKRAGPAGHDPFALLGW